MRGDQIDLVHTHLFGDSLHGYLASRRAGRPPVIMTLHIGSEGMSGVQRLGYRWLLGRSDRAIACSHFVRDSLTRLHPGAEIEVVSNGIEEPAARPDAERTALKRRMGVSAEELLFASIGRLEEQKGHTYLLRAFAKLVLEEGGAARLVLLGDGTLRAALEQEAHALGIGDRVVFGGIRDDVLELLLAIDVVVFSSLFEGLPVALLEAMATARCIVTTDPAGIVEAVRSEREALVAPTRDADQLCRQLKRAADDLELRRRLGSAARKRFVDCFTAERMVEAYERIYGEMLTAARRSGGPSAHGA
jgi:glycosyltransferase involved in cell wall biosynthesis